MIRLAVLFLVVYTATGFIDHDAIEHEETKQVQKRVLEKNDEMDVLAKAKSYYDKMKEGVGGRTIAIHHPSNEILIHQNKWILSCVGEVSKFDGHCDEGDLESLRAFQPVTLTDFCYIKHFNYINNTLCLSTHPVKFKYEKGNIFCQNVFEYFPALAITTEEYLEMCKGISENVTYIYYANERHPDHVKIPNENHYIKCDNELEEDYKSKTHSKKMKEFIEEYSFAINKPGICVFTETDTLVLKIMEYIRIFKVTIPK